MQYQWVEYQICKIYEERTAIATENAKLEEYEMEFNIIIIAMIVSVTYIILK